MPMLAPTWCVPRLVTTGCDNRPSSLQATMCDRPEEGVAVGVELVGGPRRGQREVLVDEVEREPRRRPERPSGLRVRHGPLAERERVGRELIVRVHVLLGLRVAGLVVDDLDR